MTKSNVDRLFLICAIAVSVLVYFSTDTYPGIAQKTSAVYVRFLAVCFGGLSALQLVISLFSPRNSEPMDLAEHLPKFFGLLAALILFSVSFEALGFYIGAGIFIPVVAVLLGERNYWVTGLTTLGVLAFVYSIFELLLNVNLPGPNF